MTTALEIMQAALCFKRQRIDEYIQFLCHFGPALTGMSVWNNKKTTKSLSDLLTITDEAFIHLCIINYSATWKAQEKKKLGETNVRVPVSDINEYWIVIPTSKWLTESSLPAS
jgi:hypothetical protein